MNTMAATTIPEAEAHLRALLREDPANTHAIHDLGILAHRDNRPTEALHLLRQALALDPDNLALLKSTAQITRETGDPARAAELFHRALDLDPADPLVWNAAGVCLQESYRPAQAMEAYLRALTLTADLPDVLHNIGNLLAAENDFPSAIDYFEQAIALRPDYLTAHTNLGVAYRQQLDYPRSIAHFRRAHELDPTSADIAMGYGEILSLVYDPHSEEMLRRAVALNPSRAEAHWNLALDLLKRGRYEEGFREYEWRFQRNNGHNTPRPFTQSQWLGDTDISTQTLLVHAEQGFGDTLQMLRYLPLLRERTPHLILEVQPELHRLVAIQPGITIVARGDALPPFDNHIATISLPHAVRTTLHTVPPPLQLLRTPRPQRPSNPRRVGLAWSGNPHHDRDRERSIPIHLFAPLFDIPNTTWISLQPTSNPPLIQNPLHDFLDTAELLNTLDLVITIDSAVAHLALSQHIPTILLLPYAADWRWLQPSATTPNPWYPEARILRQPSPTTGWQPMLDRLRTLIETAHT
jgi:tetratricopeptide (TPR) repeat protein